MISFSFDFQCSYKAAKTKVFIGLGVCRRISQLVDSIQANYLYFRFFEAFLESAPQMLVQGVVLTNAIYDLDSAEIPSWSIFFIIFII